MFQGFVSRYSLASKWMTEKSYKNLQIALQELFTLALTEFHFFIFEEPSEMGRMSVLRPIDNVHYPKLTTGRCQRTHTSERHYSGRTHLAKPQYVVGF